MAKSAAPGAKPAAVVEWLYWTTAVFFIVYLFVYYWTSEGGPTLLAFALVPVTFVLYTFEALRKNELYPSLPATVNYVIATLYVAVSAVISSIWASTTRS